MLEHKIIQAENERLASFAASETTGLCLHFKEYLPPFSFRSLVWEPRISDGLSSFAHMNYKQFPKTIRKFV